MDDFKFIMIIIVVYIFLVISISMITFLHFITKIIICLLLAIFSSWLIYAEEK